MNERQVGENKCVRASPIHFCSMKFVDEFQAALGIITLEDVLEELIGEDIVDETDRYVDVHKRIKVAQAFASVMRSMSRDPSNYTASVSSYSSSTL